MRAVAERRYVLLLMSGIIALAWTTLWLWGHSPYGRWLRHDGLSGAGLGDGPVVLVMVAGWTLMIVAMMLPTSLPLVAVFHRLTRRREDHVLLVGLLLAGYLGMWTAFGVVVHVGDALLHAPVARASWCWPACISSRP
jgi:predicted metal-binding membrane protein